VSATNVFYAIGKHDALCISPFGIEDFLDPTEQNAVDADLLTALNIESSGFTLNGTGPYLARSYELLGNMLGIIQKYRGTGKMTGFLQENTLGCALPFSHYDFENNLLKQARGEIGIWRNRHRALGS